MIVNGLLVVANLCRSVFVGVLFDFILRSF